MKLIHGVTIIILSLSIQAMSFEQNPSSQLFSCPGRSVKTIGSKTLIDCTQSNLYSSVNKAKITSRISHPAALQPFFDANRNHRPIYNFTRELRLQGKLVGYHSTQAYAHESSERPLKVTTRFNLNFQPVSIRVE